MTINFLISFQVKEQELDSFKNILGDVKINLPKVEGCQSVAVLAQLDNPLAFTLVETWESRALHGAHVDALVTGGQWDVIAAHLTADPASAYYGEI
jgi:quinol monooxygenase YgiN